MNLSAAQIIRDCPLFARLDEAHVNKLAAMAERCSYGRSETVFRQAESCPGVFIVISGMVRVYKLAASGKEHVLHLAGPGKTFAEVAAIADFELPAAAEAVCETTCLLLPIRPFRRLMEQDHGFCLQMLTGLAFWVRHLVELLEDIVLRDAAGRLARYLVEMSGPNGVVELPSLKKHVASYLDLTSETLSRTLRRFSDTELIRMNENQIVILDRDSLQTIAEGMASEG